MIVLGIFVKVSMYFFLRESLLKKVKTPTNHIVFTIFIKVFENALVIYFIKRGLNPLNPKSIYKKNAR